MSKKLQLIFSAFFLISMISCGSDDTRSCTTCTSDQTSTTFEVCSESSGNASVNGEDTGTPFDTYISELEAAGATCGGS